MTEAEKRCVGIGTLACSAFRERIFKRHIWISRQLASEYIRINRVAGYMKANQWLLSVEDALKLHGTGLFADQKDSDYVEYASEKSKKSEKDIMDFGRRFGSEQAIAMAEKICADAGLEYPADIKPGDSKEAVQKKHIAAMARVCDPKWWRRQVRVIAARKVEQVLRGVGAVNRQRSLYVSDFTLARRREQKRRNSKLLTDLVAENEEGFCLSLSDAAGAGVSNPVNRRNELMVRIRGYEELAAALGCVAVFITLTAPGKYHSVLASGFKNSNYNGSTPGQVQDYLNAVWARVRAAWHKEGIRVFGFRFVEPHHDGTPHWHQLLFVRREEKQAAMQIFKARAIEEDREELAAGTDARFLAVDIDPERGSAAGYVAKYVSKNIDGAEMGGDLESLHGMTLAQETALRVEAWASTWGIRQFQQIGSVSVTVWRELRRAEGKILEELAEKPEDERLQLMAELSAACEAQDWAKFVELMGGAFVARNDQTVRPWAVLADDENAYGEEFKKIRGVIMRGVYRLVTRWHVWTIRRRVVAGFSPGVLELRESQRLGLV